jgi:hypothetical protein
MKRWKVMATAMKNMPKALASGFMNLTAEFIRFSRPRKR